MIYSSLVNWETQLKSLKTSAVGMYAKIVEPIIQYLFAQSFIICRIAVLYFLNPKKNGNLANSFTYNNSNI